MNTATPRMTRTFILACTLLTLVGCERSPSVIPATLNGTGVIVCTLVGDAYFARSGAGDSSFLIRQIDADTLCSKLKMPRVAAPKEQP